MAKKKKQFSEKALQAVLSEARAAGTRPRDAAIKLFEGMETEGEAKQRKLLASQSKQKSASPPKRRSVPKTASKPKSKPKVKPKAQSKPKSGYGAVRR